MVNTEAFFTMLDLHQVILTKKEVNLLKKQFEKGDKIQYKAALNTLRIDLASAGVGEEQWVIAKQQENNSTPIFDTPQ